MELEKLRYILHILKQAKLYLCIMKTYLKRILKKRIHKGGTRKVVETETKKEIVYDEKSGTKTIITQSIVSPKIEGAIITAEGGNNTNTKANIIQAVEAVTGLPTHKIQVFEMEKTN